MTMQLGRTAVVSALLLLALGLGTEAQDRGQAPKDTKSTPRADYIPLQAGNEWHYRLIAGDKTVPITSRVAKIETIDGVPLARLEVLVGGNNASTTEHLRQTDKGVFRHRFNGQECDPPFLVLKYPVKSGDEWKGEFKTGNETAKYISKATEETIDVPAGNFKTVRVEVEVETGGKNVRTTYWFARDVGIVKQTVELGTISFATELEKYELKKSGRDRPKR